MDERFLSVAGMSQGDQKGGDEALPPFQRWLRAFTRNSLSPTWTSWDSFAPYQERPARIRQLSPPSSLATR